ncbi:hypothetical protein [Flavobacterium sp.]|uniref:hypothetical protein n=1 Tax=Flavobacterium sp. TaxID=239 RepID=UPI002FDEAAFE
METYHVNLSGVNWNGTTIFSGTVTKLNKPVEGRRNTVSSSESIGRENRIQAVNDIIEKVRDINFEENEVYFLPTYERMESLEQLRELLNQ